MRRYILKRVVLGLIALIGVSIIIFFSSRLSGDVAVLLAPQNASKETIQEIRVKLGLDKPIPVQYYIFIKNALRGDFGTSIQFQRPAMEVFLSRLPATLELGIIAFILGNFLGIILGIISATRRGSWLDSTGKLFALLGQAIPNFWIAVIMMMVFAVKLHLLPTSGIGGIKHLLMPVTCMTLFSVAFVMRITRSALLDVMESDYIKLAWIKGNPERIVIWKHALRNALIPVVTMAGAQLATIVGGAVFIETVFRWPGVGILMVNSITGRDYPLVQVITLITSATIIGMNLVVDLLYVFIDPRIKYR